MSDIASKIGKLLRLAADNPSSHEGKLAATMAQKLMAEHGVEVRLDDDAQYEVSDGVVGLVAGIYPSWDGWRHSLAMTSAMIYRLQIHWGVTVHRLAMLTIVGPEEEVTTVDLCVEFYQALERIVLQVQVPTRIFTGLSRNGSAVNVGDPWIVASFRRGLADSIGERLRPMNAEEPVEDEDAPMDTNTTALVLVKSFRVPRHEIQEPVRSGVINNEAEAIKSSSMHEAIYMQGKRLGRYCSVPRA